MCSADLPVLAGDSVQSYVTKATRDPCRVGTIIPALKMMEPRHRGVESLFQGHTAGKRPGVERGHGKLEEAQV